MKHKISYELERVKNAPIPPVRSGYTLPFIGYPLWIPEISQGFDGPYSHGYFLKKFNVEGNQLVVHYDDRFSLDWRMNPGTPVLAAIAGEVELLSIYCKKYYDGLNIQKGLNTTPNFIVLKHPDGTKTLYSHLEYASSRIEIGEWVKQGQHMANSGLSGWIGPVPHLHFAGFIQEQMNRRTFPVEFLDYDGELWHSRLTHVEV